MSPKGRMMLTPNGLELLKFSGVNLKFIPYDLVESESEKEAHGLGEVAKKITDLSQPEPWKHAKDQKGHRLNLTEPEYLAKEGLLAKGRTVADAKAQLEEAFTERVDSVRQVADALRKAGRKVEEPWDTKGFLPEKARRQLRELLKKHP